jgi:hypothetical protein
MSEEKKEVSKLEKLTTLLSDKKARLISEAEAMRVLVWQADDVIKAYEKRKQFLESEKSAPAFAEAFQVAAEDLKYLTELERLTASMIERKTHLEKKIDETYAHAKAIGEALKRRQKFIDSEKEVVHDDSYSDYLTGLSTFHNFYIHVRTCRGEKVNSRRTFSNYKYGMSKRSMTREEFEGVLQEMIIQGPDFIKESEEYSISRKEDISKASRAMKKDRKRCYENAKEELRKGRFITEVLEELLDESLQTHYIDRTPQERKPIVHEMTEHEWDAKKDAILGKIGRYEVQ